MNADATTANEVGIEDRYLVFSVSDQIVGVGISRVREIIEYRPVTAVPLSPLYMHGVLNLRGSVVPVIDLMALTEHKKISVNKRTCIVIVDVTLGEENVVAGLLADNVREVASMPAGEVDKSESLRSRFRLDLVQGIGKVGDRFVVLLNPEMLANLQDIYAVHKEESRESAAS